MRHVLDASQFDEQTLNEIFENSSKIKEMLLSGEDLRGHSGKQAFNIFYEPSTRTRMSFASAAHLLGMSVNGTENAREFSSASKGETIEDTIRVMCQYHPNVIIMRHHETGAAEKAAAVSTVPVINAGDGQGEHPTQSLLDLFTIKEKHGRLDNLNIVIGGDLAHGRTARSLAQMLSIFSDNKITFVSPDSLRMRQDILDMLNSAGVEVVETDQFEESFSSADVIYWTRVQQERIEGEVQTPYVIEKHHLSRMKEDAIIMHPLPRVGEISAEVDSDPRAVYFEQAGNGLYVRMALIDWALKA